MRKEILQFRQWFANLAGDIGSLRYEGRGELRIMAMTDDLFFVRDIYSRQKTWDIRRDDPKISQITLWREAQAMLNPQGA